MGVHNKQENAPDVSMHLRRHTDCGHFPSIMGVVANDASSAVFIHGTGSYPPLQNGLHLRIRRTARKPPLTAPYF